MADKPELQLPDMVTVGDLADKLGIPVVKLIGELFKNGIMATVNQRIDFETAEIIVSELTEHMDRLGYAYREETEDPAARFFLAR